MRDLLEKFENGVCLYENNPVFAKCVESLLRGGDIYRILESVIVMHSDLQQRYSALIQGGILKKEIVVKKVCERCGDSFDSVLMPEEQKICSECVENKYSADEEYYMGMELARAEIQKPCKNPRACPSRAVPSECSGMTMPYIKCGMKYFSYNPEDGFEIHATEAEAVSAAEASLQIWRDEAVSDGWSLDVDEICWGMIVGRIIEIKTGEFFDYQFEKDVCG
jgi:predicted  nucleic acid-binding Zn-ribbon protein